MKLRNDGVEAFCARKIPFRLSAIILLILALAACQRINTANFVGKWQSSRAVTPIYLTANGEWEIRQDDGTILQYGIWHYADKNITWSIKQGDRIIDDRNLVLDSEIEQFRLQERDGTITVFRRLH